MTKLNQLIIIIHELFFIIKEIKLLIQIIYNIIYRPIELMRALILNLKLNSN